MKKVLLTLTIIIVSITISNAQKISIEKTFGGLKFTQNGKNLTMNELVSTMQSTPKSYKLIKSAKSNNLLAQVIGGVGGGLIGFPIGTAIGGGKPNWTLAGIGAGLVGISIPISSNVKKKVKKAVEIYNSSLNFTTSNNFNPNFKIIANRNGIGLSMNF